MEVTFWVALERGGWLMLPLSICSLMALAIIIDRLIWGPRRSSVIPARILSQARLLVHNSKLDEALGLLRSSSSSLSKLISAAIQNKNKPRAEIVEALEIVGRAEANRMLRFVPVLTVIAAISPLLGLLGTVFGMIQTFNVIGQQGLGDAQALAGGIAEALITTAAGLSIAIPALVFSRYFTHQAKKLILEMETICLEMLESIATTSDSTIR